MKPLIPKIEIVSANKEKNINNINRTQIQLPNILNKDIEQQIKYSASTSDSFQFKNQNIFSNNSEEDEENNYSSEQNLNIQIIENSKPFFTTQLKPINKKKIKNSLQKQKLELFYKDKLNLSLITQKEDYYNIDEINDAILSTQKIEDQYNKLLNIEIEKDPEKEEMKMLYKTQSEQIIYEKSFGNFYGFTVISFKNRKRINSNKLQIQINLYDQSKQKNLNFFGIYEGHKGLNVSNYLKKILIRK